MRISTSQITSAGVREMLLRQAEIQHTQLQLATQQRVLTPSDDPVAATAISALESEIEQLEQFNVNSDAAKASNELEESVLSSVTNIFFRVKELMVSLGNGVYDEQDLDSISIELQERLKELVGLANTQNANGEYLFSGSLVDVKTVTRDIGGSFVYNGDQSQRFLRVSSGVVVPTSDHGFDLFVDIKNGNGKFVTSADAANTGTGLIDPGSYQAPPNFLTEPYTIAFSVDVNGDTNYTVTGDISGATIIPATVWQEGDEITFNGITTEVNGTPLAGDQFGIAPSTSENIFSNIQLAIDSITSFQDTEAGRALFYNAITGVQETLDRNMENIDLHRGKVGAQLNVVESEFESNLFLLVTSQSSLSEIKDLDVVEASTRFSQQLVVLEAAQASFVRVQGLNLFNFL